MSLTRISSSSPPSSKLFHKPIHHRNDSDELDVFEAAKYFSGYNEPIPHHYTTSKNRASSVSRRMSLDTSMSNINDHQQQILKEKTFVNRNGKPYKQPSSPGGRLASFLNTLFHQAAGGSKKKNKKKQPPKSTEEEDEISPCGRKRRSSISYFSRSFADTKSWYSATSSKSEFRRSPPPLCTPTKAGFRTVVCGSNQKPVSGRDSWCLDEKMAKLSSNDGLLLSGCEESKVDDDGGESDASSDLFELQNYDLDAYSSGLPVYETTDVGSITSGK
ncbi:unnamed protein product [Linum tenue]|uniref:Protein BIG GRAIN 1-like E n=1 Tax=Linum tenue TaxID=586396 RepID=A0AAV0HZU0_9ROSI|nr:unnamed protein product [Linum tenue]